MVKKNTDILTMRTRVIVGGIGGIAPLIISLLVIDLRSAFDGLELMDWIGMSVRIFVLIFIGALVGYLHNTESEPFKVFQLGIAAPALLTTAINGYGVTGSAGTSIREITTVNTEQIINWKFDLIPSAHASEVRTPSRKKYVNSNAFLEPKISNTERFLRGLIGKRVSSKGDDWFVIVGSHSSMNKAKKQIRKLGNKNFQGKIYQPSNGSKYYAVMIGANMNIDNAQALREKAIKRGLPRDTYLWRR